MKYFIAIAMVAGTFVTAAQGDNYGGAGARYAAADKAMRSMFPACAWDEMRYYRSRESGSNPYAANWGDSNGGSHGLYQINGIHRSTFGERLWSKRYTIWGGTRMAYLLYRGSGFAPWGGYGRC